MPTYEFLCYNCQEAFEKRLNADDRGKTQECPECGSNHTIRQLSPVVVFYRGEGFTLSNRGTNNADNSR